MILSNEKHLWYYLVIPWELWKYLFLSEVDSYIDDYTAEDPPSVPKLEC